MATLHQTPSAYLRTGLAAAQKNRGNALSDSRPYLITPESRKNSKSPAPKYLALFPHESEDARITGATRSLYRRLLALNLPKSKSVTPVSASSVSVEAVMTGSRIA
jgi:hypothetical protein